MAKVDDLLEKRAKQVVLAIVARLAHGSPPTANLAVEGITDHPNRESQTAIKPACTPGFLAKLIPCSGQIVAINQIDWDFLAGRFGSVCRLGPGQPPLPTRLVAGL